MAHKYDGDYVYLKHDIVYGNPGRHFTVKAGTFAFAKTATNLPSDSNIEYWLRPVGNWPKKAARWAQTVGCGANDDDIESFRRE